jgi:signal transduction histidine kinase
MLNLLSNAIEYNRPGGTINVQVGRVGGNGTLDLIVHDTGIGISGEQLPHVFEPFYRGGAAGDDAQHLGLGLFLVRSHVESMRGKCDIQSKLGEGTIMRITLPEPANGVTENTLAAAQDAAPGTAPATSASVDPQAAATV